MTNSSRGGLVRRARTHLALTAASGLVVAGAVTGYLAIDGGTATAQSETSQSETTQQPTTSTTTDPESGSSTDPGSTSGSSGLSSTDQSGPAAGGSNAS